MGDEWQSELTEKVQTLATYQAVAWYSCALANWLKMVDKKWGGEYHSVWLIVISKNVISIVFFCDWHLSADENVEWQWMTVNQRANKNHKSRFQPLFIQRKLSVHVFLVIPTHRHMEISSTSYWMLPFASRTLSLYLKLYLISNFCSEITKTALRFHISWNTAWYRIISKDLCPWNQFGRLLQILSFAIKLFVLELSKGKCQ